MSEINSPLGRRNMAMAASRQQRVLTVPNGDDPTPTEQNEVQQFTSDAFKVDEYEAVRKAAMENKKRITSSGRERIELLANLGRAKRDVDVDGMIFTIQSLKTGEIRDVIQICMPIEDKFESYFETRAQTLARAITAIGDAPIGLVLGNDDPATVMSWLDSMDEGVVEFLHKNYLDLIDKHKDKFKLDVKNVAEVSEEIKK